MVWWVQNVHILIYKLFMVCQTFFEELLKEKTIVIPGIFFDINPSHRRNLFHSPCHHFVRLSFGPPLEDLNAGETSTPLFPCSLISCHQVLMLWTA